MVIVLVMHGMTPRDFPAEEKREFFRLNSLIEGNPRAATPEQISRHAELDRRMREWPRTPENDPFAKASCEIAGELRRQTGTRVFVGFNEFCSPDVPEAIDMAVKTGDREVVVITPMVTRGGNHSEVEIPALVEESRKKYPDVCFSYAWPIPAGDTAAFLAGQVRRVSRTRG